jgi:hypothetical protein
MAKKRIRTFEDFETSGGNYIALSWDMIDSIAWKSLSPHEIALYLHMRRKYIRKVASNGQLMSSNKDNISVPEQEVRKMKLMSVNTFWKSIDVLIDKGFIILNHRGSRFDKVKCNIYELYHGWKRYPNYKPKLEHIRKATIE